VKADGELGWHTEVTLLLPLLLQGAPQHLSRVLEVIPELTSAGHSHQVSE